MDERRAATMARSPFLSTCEQVLARAGSLDFLFDSLDVAAAEGFDLAAQLEVAPDSF
jgi:hypothetical protein